MVHVSTNMTTSEFITKVAKIFNVKKQLICVTYEFPNTGHEDAVKVEIEEGDDSSLLHAINILNNYSKLTVEVKMLPMSREFAIMDGKRALRSKEFVLEQLKREMGLHNDEGKRKRGFLDAAWTERCDELMARDSRFLLEFDKVKAGMKVVLGDDGYLLNPCQVLCPICLEIKVLCSMNQIRSLLRHLREKHHNQPAAIDAANRLDAWMANNFITEEELTKKAALPDGLVSPTQMLSTPRVRALLLTRDIS